MVVGENKRSTNIMDGIENTGDVRLHDHRLRLKQRFDIVRKLGQGTYGKVQLGINKKTGQEVAIKTIKKCKIESEADLVRIRREVQIMSSVRHPNIVHIYEVFENSEKMILVMEYCSGGELYDYLSQKKVLEEDEARRLFRQIATAVYYCHIHKICHRDLKLENVLLDDTGSAKIADFGLSNVFKETSLLSTFCGSPLYASPEIVKGTPYIGPEVDCWSLGVLLYTLVYGAMPFDGSNFKRLVRQISNGDYYEPKSPSTASPLIRDMLTVDPLKRADIAYICDHPWVNTGCEISCLEMAEALAAETPVRLDLLLSLAPAAPSNSNSVVVPPETDLGPEESCTDLTSSTSMAVEPSNSAEKRILELVAEGGEDAIKPSPTRTIVSAGDNKRKLEIAMSNSGLQRKKERVASSANVPSQPAPLPEEISTESSPEDNPAYVEEPVQTALKTSATRTIAPTATGVVASPTRDVIYPKQELPQSPAKETTLSAKKSLSPPRPDEYNVTLDAQTIKEDDAKSATVSSAADKLTSLSLAQPAPANHTPTKPKKLSIPGGSVGSFKEQFERRASLTTGGDVKRITTKPAISKIAKPKAQSEDREIPSKMPESGTVRLQQIGIQPPKTNNEEISRGGVKKTESEPTHSTAVDPSVLLQDARRSLQNSMAKLVEEKVGEENRRRAARDIITSAIRTGKPPMPYGRSSSAGVASLTSPPSTPPAHAPPPVPTTPATAPAGVLAPKLYRTEAQHRVEDHRNRRMVSTESTGSTEGEPIKKSAREFIIPIAVEGKGYVTPRQRSVEPEAASAAANAPSSRTRTLPRTRIRPGAVYSSLVSGGESDEEDDTHMHRLRTTRAARAESVSSGEEDEEDEGFHLLTAENLFSTLLHRVRALTNRLNGEEGPGFPQHPHSLFNNLQSPFFNSPHLPRRNFLREGWGARDLHADFDSMFNKSRQQMPRGNSKKSSKHVSKPQENEETSDEKGLDLSDLDLSSIQLSDREVRALSGLTPALSRRLQQQLLAHLPPAAARSIRRTLSLHNTSPQRDKNYLRSNSASKSVNTDPVPDSNEKNISNLILEQTATEISDSSKCKENVDTASKIKPKPETNDYSENLDKNILETPFCTLPRLKRHSNSIKESSPTISTTADFNNDYFPKLGKFTKDLENSRSNISGMAERPLLSKYLSPEKNYSLDESYSSDSGSILSEPSYIAAYGSPVSSFSTLGLRRHSMRLSGEHDAPRKRISRFLRPDFYDTPPDESLYAKHKKEKEIETQKILREIREKKNKMSEVQSPRVSAEPNDIQLKDDSGYSRKCLSPNNLLTGKERSRSITPFYPILDNITETLIDCTQKPDMKTFKKLNDSSQKPSQDTSCLGSKLTRPKSYPVKDIDSENDKVSQNLNVENVNENQVSLKESKLIRPKSYPTSSSSPEKTFDNNIKNEVNPKILKDDNASNKSDIEVSFSISLPRKNKPSSQCKETTPVKLDEIIKNESLNSSTNDLVQTDYVNPPKTDSAVNSKDLHISEKDVKINVISVKTQSEVPKTKSNDSVKSDSPEKKGTIKKKIIKKVPSKYKTDVDSSQLLFSSKGSVEKKKIVKKSKDKNGDDHTESPVIKKKSVLQSLGHKLEKLKSAKSVSPEKGSDNYSSSTLINKENHTKLNRMQREQSVPVSMGVPLESNVIKRATTLTNVAALDNQNISSKTTVSKVFGLFKKNDSKDKSLKVAIDKPIQNTDNNSADRKVKNDYVPEIIDKEKDKIKRPTSLLLNGLRKNKNSKSCAEAIETANSDEQSNKKESDNKTLRNSLKLDFSRLPRVKKIVPSTPVIEPKIINISSTEKTCDRKSIFDKTSIDHNLENNEQMAADSQNRSRSRSRSTFSNPDIKTDQGSDAKLLNFQPSTSSETTIQQLLRNHDSTTPEKEDVVERIRRKSFYTRFNEKKQRRKSNLVGPGAIEYDPLARLHSPTRDTKYDTSPTSPETYDLSPGFSVKSDMSPSTDNYRSFLTDSGSNRRNLRYDNYDLNEKVDTYRSLDRNDFRKYPGTKSLDYDQPSIYAPHRYSRTKSLLDSTDEIEDRSRLGNLKDFHKYNRTLSVYSPGNYATYRPKIKRNSAIILKESEKEPSPENILDKIRHRKKMSISVTRQPDLAMDSAPRPNNSSKGENNGPERFKKID